MWLVWVGWRERGGTTKSTRYRARKRNRGFLSSWVILLVKKWVYSIQGTILWILVSKPAGAAKRASLPKRPPRPRPRLRAPPAWGTPWNRRRSGNCRNYVGERSSSDEDRAERELFLLYKIWVGVTDLGRVERERGTTQSTRCRVEEKK